MAKSPAAKKKTGRNSQNGAEKKSRAKTSKAAGSKAEPSRAKTAKAKGSKKAADKGDVAVTTVNLGHVFALRPRVNTSFPQSEFAKAKAELEDERFASIQEAARAVAEKALENTNRKTGKSGIGRRS